MLPVLLLTSKDPRLITQVIVDKWMEQWETGMDRAGLGQDCVVYDEIWVPKNWVSAPFQLLLHG